MSICAAVFPTDNKCPENLRSFNEDGTRIDDGDDKRAQSELGSQGVLNATLRAAEARKKSVVEAEDGGRKDSFGSGLSGVTLRDEQEKGKNAGLLKKLFIKGKSEK